MLLPRLEDGLHAGSPFSIPEDVMVQDQGPHIRGPEDPGEVGERPLRVHRGIVFWHVRHRPVDVEDGRLGIDEEREVLLQRRSDHVRRVDERLAPLGNPRHDDVAEFVVVAVRHRGREQELRPAVVDLVAVGHLDLSRIPLQLANEGTRAFPLTPVDVELAILQERRLATKDRGRCRVVMIVMVVADGENVRLRCGGPDDLPEFFLPRPFALMWREVVPVGSEPDAWIQQDRHVRRLDEGCHGPRAEAVGGERDDPHRITPSPKSWRLSRRKPRFRTRSRLAVFSVCTWRAGIFPRRKTSLTIADVTDKAYPRRRYGSRT